MSMTCITCGSTMPDISEFCPSCGRAVQLARSAEQTADATPKPSAFEGKIATLPDPIIEPENASPTPQIALNDRLAAAAAYFTFLPACAFLLMKSYSTRRFVRFHSLQSVFFWALVAVFVGAGVLVSTIGFLLLWLFAGTLVVLGVSLTWLLLSVKALQGEWFRLPALGDVCEQIVSAR